MNSEIFLKTHRETWERLNQILDRMNQKGPSGLGQEELRTFGALFRRVTAHLAFAQANFPGHEITEYLNNLVVKAHGHIYKQETFGAWGVKNFFRHGFPALLREQRHFIIIAGLVLILGLVTGYLLHFLQPALDGYILPDEVKHSIRDSISNGQIGAGWPVAQRSAISSAIMINNIKVGIFAFALGFTWGVGTMLVLFNNGLMVGVLGAIYAHEGYGLDFWSLILPHGVLELTAIFICGGAGLVLAQALVKPGEYTRRDALPVQGRIAVKLVIGTIPLFVGAALIEGFITPSMLPHYFKLAFAVATLIALFFYFHGSRKYE